MAALEWQVITEILKTHSLAEPLKKGLHANHFKDPEARQIYEFLHEHWMASQTAMTLPSMRFIRGKWPSFQPTARTDENVSELSALIQELKRKSFESDARSLASYFNETVDQDPEEVVRDVKNKLDDLVYQLHASERLTLSGIADTARTHYKNAQNGSVMGIPWPWPPLSEDTLGKQPGTFTVFYGRMKSMKTWILIYCAALDYMENHQRVLIWSREMNKDQIALRIASVIAGVDYQLFKKGKLPPQLEKKLFETLDMLMTSDGEMRSDAHELSNIVILAGRGAPRTTAELHGALMEYQPTVLYLDSFYHLRSDRERESAQRWARLATIAEEVKELAQDFNLPVIATHQANRDGEKKSQSQGDLLDVADSDAIAREADLIVRILKRKGKPLHEDAYEAEMARIKQAGTRRIRIRLPKKFKAPSKALFNQDEPPPRVGAEIGMILGGNREGVLEAFTIHAIPGYNFSLISSNYSSDEIKKWVKEDDKEAAKAAGVADGVPKKAGLTDGMREALKKATPQRVLRRL